MDINRRDVLLAGLCAPLHAVPAVAARDTAEAFQITVYQEPTCGCCTAWVKHMREAGFAATTMDVDRQYLQTLKAMVRVPPALSGCHTAWVEGYVLEGHVPAGDVLRLLVNRPDAVGLAVPGMPIGSPGMETSDESEPFDTWLIRHGAPPLIFARHR